MVFLEVLGGKRDGVCLGNVGIGIGLGVEHGDDGEEVVCRIAERIEESRLRWAVLKKEMVAVARHGVQVQIQWAVQHDGTFAANVLDSDFVRGDALEDVENLDFYRVVDGDAV